MTNFSVHAGGARRAGISPSTLSKSNQSSAEKRYQWKTPFHPAPLCLEVATAKGSIREVHGSVEGYSLIFKPETPALVSHVAPAQCGGARAPRSAGNRPTSYK